MLKPFWPLWPIALGVIGFIAGVLLAPNIKQGEPPDWFTAFFSATAGLIVVVGVPIAIGGLRVGSTNARAAAMLFGLVAFGAFLSLIGLDTSLPAWTYKFLVGAAIGGIVATLVAMLVVGTKTLRVYEEKRRADNTKELERKGRR
jgi:hypothetical protein